VRQNVVEAMLGLKVALASLVLGAEGLDLASTNRRSAVPNELAQRKVSLAMHGHIITFVKQLKHAQHSHRVTPEAEPIAGATAEAKPIVEATPAAEPIVKAKPDNSSVKLRSTSAGNATKSNATKKVIAAIDITTTAPFLSPEDLQAKIVQVWGHKAELEKLNETITAEKSLLQKQQDLQALNDDESVVFKASLEQAKSIKVMIAKSHEDVNASRQEAIDSAKKILRDVTKEREAVLKEEMQDETDAAEATEKRQAAEGKMKESAKAIKESQEAHKFFSTEDVSEQAWLRKPLEVTKTSSYWEAPDAEAEAAYNDLRQAQTDVKTDAVPTPSTSHPVLQAQKDAKTDAVPTASTSHPVLQESPVAVKPALMALSDEVNENAATEPPVQVDTEETPKLESHGSADLDELANLAEGGFLDSSSSDAI